MIFLESSTTILQVILAANVATNQLPFFASWADMSSTNFLPSATYGTTNNSTAVTIVAAPGAGLQRQVKYIDINNADTAAAAITVRHFDGTNIHKLVLATIDVNESLVYDEHNGWQVITSTGAVKTSGGSGSGGTVTSVGLSLPGIFTVSGSPVTTSGTLTAVLAAESSTTFFAGPVSGSPALPTFRAISSTDIPALAYVPLTRNVNTNAPLTGGGALSADLTLAITQSGSTTNGYLSSTDWNAFHSGGGSTSFANPTATVGLTPTNGSASTAMRSDASPSLSSTTSFNLHPTLTDSSGTGFGLQITPQINQSGTASFTGLFVDCNRLATGSGGQSIMSLAIDHFGVFTVDSDGDGFLYGTMNAANLSVNNNIFVGRQVTLVGASPSAAPDVGAGSGGTAVAAGQDCNGQITVVTGTLPTGSNALIATITPNSSFNATPFVVISPANANAAAIGGTSEVFIGGSSAAFNIVSGTVGLAAGTTYVWNYVVFNRF